MQSATKKVLLIILDGVGAGELPDAGLYGDAGSNTLGHTARAVGGLKLPHLSSLGLGNILPIDGVPAVPGPAASFGRMAEVSKGKDSTTGHWELCGLMLKNEFPTFPDGFPGVVMEGFMRETGCKGYLGNKAASGTVIIQELGEQHLSTGFPIVYTSADSVFQIAAHEEVIPLPRLYEICTLTRERVCTGAFAVGRVIARPFVGTVGTFVRTTSRRDFSLDPPAPTLLDVLHDAGVETIGVGKIEDLFAFRGLSKSFHTRTNVESIECVRREAARPGPLLIIANLGDFDTLFGHRNDPRGFADALQAFDSALPGVMETLGNEDVLIITADHGNDPSGPSTDHAREYVPLLWYRKGGGRGTDLGTRSTFADVGKTIADSFSVENTLAGESFLSRVS